MAEFLAALVDLAPAEGSKRRTVPDVELVAMLDEPWALERGRTWRGTLVAVGGPSGGGATEVAVHLAASDE